MATIQLDVNCDMTLGELYDWSDKFKLKAQIVTLFGPGGGNPIIQFEGEKQDLIDLMYDYGWDDDEIEEFYPDL